MSPEREAEIRTLAGAFVAPSRQLVVKLMPASPPRSGEIILVDGVRCRVTSCRVRWDRSTSPGSWTILSLRVKPA